MTCVDTGLDTPTGGRILALRDHVAGRRFCATYADGVADVSLDRAARSPREGGALATMTVVRPELQFGVTELDAGRAGLGLSREAPLRALDQRGLLRLRAGLLRLSGARLVLEREPLERLAGEGRLLAYRHDGFWDCMDTYKDAVLLNDLWHTGAPPWRVWSP